MFLAGQAVGPGNSSPARDRDIRPSLGRFGTLGNGAVLDLGSPVVVSLGCEVSMIALFLLLVIVAIVLGIIGVVAKGLLYLLIIGIVVFLGALIFAALRMRRRPGKGPAR
jgi:uncharacterized membrane protein YgdD (TMEM256/DUF423 family)